MVIAPAAEQRDFNDADLRYVRRALFAGRDARAASDLAATWANDADVRAVALRARAMQEDVIGELASMLKGWGGREGLDHADPTTPSHLAAVAVSDLPPLSGTEVDRRLIESLIAHAEGAIASARTEMIEGFDPASRRVAQATIRANCRYLGALGRLAPGPVPGGGTPPLVRLA